MKQIAVIDYGMGNLRSVSKALEHVTDADTRVQVTADERIIKASDSVVCPGQGAAQDCMQQLQDSGMDQAVKDSINDGKPFLGICMGLQVLLTNSEENNGIECLDIIPGSVSRFADDMYDADSGERLKIPHMGWSQVYQTSQHPLWWHIEQATRFYFCHSYFVSPQNPQYVVGSCEYGSRFSAVLARGNVFACQFHPEKSAAAGLQLLRNFTRWNGVGCD